MSLHTWAADLWSGFVRLALFLVVASALAVLRRAVDCAEQLARTDPLTGLLNRRAFTEIAAAEIERSRRYKHPVSVVFFDLDGFKEVNDALGHAHGDELLGVVAQETQSAVRSVDTVARIGGDEFVILMPETPMRAARAVVRKLMRGLKTATVREGRPLSLSAGIASFDSTPASVDDMLSLADSLMYGAKDAGKGRVEHRVFA